MAILPMQVSIVPTFKQNTWKVHRSEYIVRKVCHLSMDKYSKVLN